MGTKIIALDAGHGLKTPGKRTPDGIHEKMILAIKSKMVKE